MAWQRSPSPQRRVISLIRWKRLLVVIALGVALLGVPAYPEVSEAIATYSMAHSESSVPSKRVSTHTLERCPKGVSGCS